MVKKSKGEGRENGILHPDGRSRGRVSVAENPNPCRTHPAPNVPHVRRCRPHSCCSLHPHKFGAATFGYCCLRLPGLLLSVFRPHSGRATRLIIPSFSSEAHLLAGGLSAFRFQEAPLRFSCPHNSLACILRPHSAPLHVMRVDFP